MSNNQIIKVNFHDSELYIVDCNGEPYTPMKPIVEGMGLDWKSQHRKLVGRGGCGHIDQPSPSVNEEGDNHAYHKWGVKLIPVPTLGDTQKSVCIPLKRIYAWLLSVNPNKVKKSIRDTVVLYQRECDDILWEYWTTGRVQPKSDIESGTNEELSASVVTEEEAKYRVYVTKLICNRAWYWAIKHRDTILLAIKDHNSPALEYMTEEIALSYTNEAFNFLAKLHNIPNINSLDIYEKIEKWVPRDKASNKNPNRIMRNLNI